MPTVPAAAADDIRQRNAVGRWYYPGMAVVMIAVAVAGFAPSVMADRAGLSVRQFQRIFLHKVGVSPKLFARIARFEAALDRMARSSAGS